MNTQVARSVRPLHLLVSLALATGLQAQVSTATTNIGTKGSYGCQNSANPPTLTGGVRASARLAYRYDASTGRLELSVTNTSPVTKGVANPVLTQLYFNLPQRGITAIRLISQTAKKGKAAFTMTQDLNLLAAPNPIKVGCFGNFSICLNSGQGSKGGIANEAADRVVGNDWITGPVRFVMSLRGPAVRSLSASAIARGFSQNASRKVTAAAKFQRGGRSGDESGFLSNGNDCAGLIYLSGTARKGTTIPFCMSAATGCHGCLLISLNKGPTKFGNLVIPIGMPILEVVSLPPFPPSNTVCLPFAIPDDARLVGKNFYFSLATLSPGLVLEFSPRFTVTVTN